jgi:hypothetical protein
MSQTVKNEIIDSFSEVNSMERLLNNFFSNFNNMINQSSRELLSLCSLL